MHAMTADAAPQEWTDDEWTENFHKVLHVVTAVRGMTAPAVADAIPMPRSTFYDKLKKGSFTALELRRLARVLGVAPSVFYEPVDTIVGGLRTGSFSPLALLPEVEGQGSLDDALAGLDCPRPPLAAV